VVGNDTAQANDISWPGLGRAAIQVFLAPDTLVSSITFWKPALPEALDYPMQFFITSTESTFSDSTTGPNPLPLVTLFASPFFSVPYTDGVHAKPITIVFNPPFQLPGRGYYAFAIKDASCSGFVDLLGDTLNSYPYGAVWKSIPKNDCSGLGDSWDRIAYGGWDLIFQIEFCEIGSPAIRETWGSLKARYR
jgi:hypothetical protein